MFRSTIFAALIAIGLMTVAGCSQGKTSENNAESSAVESSSVTRDEKVPSPTALTGLSAREALKVANDWKGDQRVTSFVDSQKVHFSFASGATVSVPLPEGEMVVAIAPYMQTTHPCEIHYMSGCQGELVDLPFEVIAMDGEGNTIINDTYRTMKNGFLELWLPRDKEFLISISGGGKSVQGRISTSASDNTCITTLRLR